MARTPQFLTLRRPSPANADVSRSNLNRLRERRSGKYKKRRCSSDGESIRAHCQSSLCIAMASIEEGPHRFPLSDSAAGSRCREASAKMPSSGNQAARARGAPDGRRRAAACCHRAAGQATVITDHAAQGIPEADTFSPHESHNRLYHCSAGVRAPILWGTGGPGRGSGSCSLMRASTVGSLLTILSYENFVN